MSREWPEKVSQYRGSRRLLRIATLRQVQTGRGQFSSSADCLLCTVRLLGYPGHVISVCLFVLSLSFLYYHFLMVGIQILESFASIDMC